MALESRHAVMMLQEGSSTMLLPDIEKYCQWICKEPKAEMVNFFNKLITSCFMVTTHGE